LLNGIACAFVNIWTQFALKRIWSDVECVAVNSMMTTGKRSFVIGPYMQEDDWVTDNFEVPRFGTVRSMA